MHPRDLDVDLLPWSAEAEAGVLGALLRDNALWDQVGDLLLARHFYDAGHAAVFDAIAALIVAARPADVLTVHDHLEKAGKSEAVGGLARIAALEQGVGSARNARRYAEIVAERAMMRGLIEAADKAKALATQAGLSVAERVDQAQAAFAELQTSGGRAMPTTMDESVVRACDRVQALADGKIAPGIPTGIASLDKALGGGIKVGKQVVLAARPSIGKSSLAFQICLNLASNGHPAAFLSQEMSKDDLTDRAIANRGQVPLGGVITGRMDDNEWGRFSEGVERLRGLPLYMDDQPGLTLHDIAAKARMLKRQHGVRLIVIDYLQLCAGGRDEDSRHHQIEKLSRGLKTLAQQLDVCFLTLSQLNREVEKRTSGRPTSSDLKESGAIEEDADVVMLLSRNGDPSPDGLQLINLDLPKNRQGRTGPLTLGFRGEYQQWFQAEAPVEFKPSARRSYTNDV